MKIILLSAPFRYYKGGSELQYSVIGDFLKMTHEVRYLFRYPGVVDDENCVTYDYWLRKHYSQYNLTDSLKIYTMMKSINPDIIYKRGVNYISAIAAIYAKLHRKKFVLHIASSRDVIVPTSSKGFKEKLKKTFDHLVAKYVLNNADVILAQANYQTELLREHYHISADAVFPNVFPESKATLEKQNQVIWVGNIKPVKQPDHFIRLAKAMSDCDCKFIMIGRPGENEWAREIVRSTDDCKNLSYLGEVELDQVNNLISQSLILVNTSSYEGFPNTYIQAFMGGTPVLTLKINPDEILEKHGIGICSGSFWKMEKDLRSLLDYPKRIESMGKRAKLYARENHGNQRLRQYQILFEELVN